MKEKIVLYHGSSNIIEQPRFGLGKPNNDYGLGFYCAESVELAKEWACSAESDGYANQYEFDLSGLSVLSLTDGEYNILNWLAILLENRKFRVNAPVAAQAKQYLLKNFLVDYRRYDVIKGYRADDSYFSFATAFLNNTISLSKLEKAMQLGKLGELGEQVVAVSKRSFEAFSFAQAIPVAKEIYYPKKLARDTAARGEFFKEKELGSALTETYMLDILREGWKADDKRLQRVVLG